jgi:hypothetical protein
MSEQPLEPGGIEEGPAPGPPTAEAPAERYGAAVQQLFDSDDVVREALRDKLVDITVQSLELRAEAATAFSGFYPSRIPEADRSKTTYFAPGDDLVELQTEQTNGALEQQRASGGGGRLRLYLTPALLEIIDTTDATDQRVGWIPLTVLLERLRDSVPLPPTDLISVCHAEGRADDLLEAITKPPTPHDQGIDKADRPPKPPEPPREEPNRPEVLTKIKELLAAMRTPETAPAFEVPARADQGTVREGLATFELRSGPADVCALEPLLGPGSRPVPPARATAGVASLAWATG